MPDREKVIEGLKLCAVAKCGYKCPYEDIDACRKQLLLDAAELLKQNPELAKPRVERHEVKVSDEVEAWPEYTAALRGRDCERAILSISRGVCGAGRWWSGMDEQRFDLYVDGELAFENMTIKMAAVMLEALFEYNYRKSNNGVAITIKGRVADDS